MTTIHYSVRLRSYIADPYWPEQERLINITKESGMNRARSTANRRAALEQHLKQIGMTLAEFEQLEQDAQRPFHTDNAGNVVVPRSNVEAMMVATCDTIRAAGRPVQPGQVRTSLRLSAWTTDIAAESAGTWERFAVVSSGTGAKLSNQRGLRSNRYVGDDPPADVPPTGKVTASGTVELNPEMVKPDVLRQALVYAGDNVGIGASRKMGWGRFELIEWGS